MSILAVLLLGLYHFYSDDYYGRPYYSGSVAAAAIADHRDIEKPKSEDGGPSSDAFTPEDLEKLRRSGSIEEESEMSFEGGELFLKDGKIKQRGATVVYRKIPASLGTTESYRFWNSKFSLFAKKTAGGRRHAQLHLRGLALSLRLRRHLLDTLCEGLAAEVL